MIECEIAKHISLIAFFVKYVFVSVSFVSYFLLKILVEKL